MCVTTELTFRVVFSDTFFSLHPRTILIALVRACEEVSVIVLR